MSKKRVKKDKKELKCVVPPENVDCAKNSNGHKFRILVELALRSIQHFRIHRHKNGKLLFV